MRRSKFTEEQIIGILKEHRAGLSAGELCRTHGISSATFYGWKAKYGRLSVSEAKRLRALERTMGKSTSARCPRNREHLSFKLDHSIEASR